MNFKFEKVFDDETDEWVYEVHQIKKIQGSFFEKLELYNFPFDVQVSKQAGTAVSCLVYRDDWFNENYLFLKDLSITLTSHRNSDEIFLVQGN